MDYVERLTGLRLDRDLTQKDIAELLHCKQAAVSKYETGRVPYRIEDLVTLYRFYGVSADYILGLPQGLEYIRR